MADNQDRFWQSYYGPAETPAMFADKWHIKFRDFLEQNYFQPQRQETPDPSWVCIFCIERINHVRTFQSQAVRFSIAHSDYPQLESALLAEGEISALSAEGEMSKMKKHPHVGAVHVASKVNWQAFGLAKVKHGEIIEGLLSWNSLPLRWRQAMNETFLLLDEGTAAGWWDRPVFWIEEFEDIYEENEIELRKQLWG